MNDETEKKPASLLAEELRAIAAIGRSQEGVLLHRHLRRVLESLPASEESGALYSNVGRRTLARELMTLMREGIEANAGSAGHGSEPILAGGQSADSVGRRGPARRGQVAADAAEWLRGGSEPTD